MGCHALLQGIFPTQGRFPASPGIGRWSLHHWPLRKPTEAPKQRPSWEGPGVGKGELCSLLKGPRENKGGLGTWPQCSTWWQRQVAAQVCCLLGSQSGDDACLRAPVRSKRPLGRNEPCAENKQNSECAEKYFGEHFQMGFPVLWVLLPGVLSLTESGKRRVPPGTKRLLFCFGPQHWLLFWVPTKTIWKPTPVILPGESHGGRSLVGYSPWGRKELETTEWLHCHFHQDNNLEDQACFRKRLSFLRLE